MIFLVSCAKEDGATGDEDSSYTTVVLPSANISCDGISCISSNTSNSSQLRSTASIPASDYADIVRNYQAGKEIVDEDIQETIDEMDLVLVKSGIENCDAIPISGNKSVTIEGNAAVITFAAASSATMFGNSVTFDKKLSVSIASTIVFQASLTCGAVSAAILEGNFTGFDTEDYKFKAHIYNDGTDKSLALYQEFEENSVTNKYMMHFNTAGGKQFTVSMADSSIPAVIVLQQNAAETKLRLAYSETPSANLTTGALTAISTSPSGTNHTCIDNGSSSPCTDWTTAEPSYSGVTTDPVPPLSSGSFSFDITGLNKVDFTTFESL